MSYNPKIYNKVRDEKLGFDVAKARHQLYKNVYLMLLQNSGMDKCIRCGKSLTAEDISIDHIVGFTNQPDPKAAFFDLDNIAFSHLECNMKHKEPRDVKHGTNHAYNQGCRCELCKHEHKLFMRGARKRAQERHLAEIHSKS